MLRLCLLKLPRQSKLDECQPLTATGVISFFFFFSRKKEKETIISRNNRETILKSMTTTFLVFLVVCIRTRRMKIIVKTMRKRANRINLQSICLLESSIEKKISCCTNRSINKIPRLFIEIFLGIYILRCRYD